MTSPGDTRRNFPVAAVFCIAAALAGCAGGRVQPDLRTDAVTVAASDALRGPDGRWPEETWWDAFGDAGLAQVIGRTLAANPDLASAAARARAAAARARAAGAGTRPGVDASASVARERLSANGLVPPPYGGTWIDTGSVSARLSWNLDVFGAERARIGAARASAEAADLEARYARTATAAAAARLYFEMVGAQADRRVVAATLAQRQAVLRVTQGRVRAGLDSPADLRQSEAQVPALELELAQADERIALARAQLAALAGEGPDWAAGLVVPESLAAPPWGVPGSLTVELLGRRADVAAARLRAIAAARQVDAAQRDAYPNLSLAALAGLDALALENLLQGSSRTFSAGPALSLPIFDAGRRRAARDARAAELDAAQADFRRTVLDAVRDAASAIARLRSSAEQRRAAAAALASEREALRIARLRYDKGLGSLLEVLVVQDRALGLERRAAVLEARDLALRVDLVEALGGGYAPTGEGR